jgi:hypothetical protein
MTFSLFFFCVCHFQTACHSRLLVIHSCLSFRSEAEESASSLLFVIPQRSGGICFFFIACHSAAKRRDLLLL